MSIKADILIIGGGSIGLNCAYYLLKSGRKVTVVDSGEIARGSSSGNAGHIVPSHIVPLAAPGIIGTAMKWMLDPNNSPFGMKISLDPSYLSWLIRFAAACSNTNVQRAIPLLNSLGQLSYANFLRLIADEKFDCNYQRTGLLFLYKTREAFAGGKHEAETLHQHGLPAEILDKEAVHQREPAALPDVIGGVHFTGDASLNPARFLELLSKRVRELGAEIYENDPVTGFENAEKTIRFVRTAREDFRPEQVVLAAGAWSPHIVHGLKLNIPVQPARGYSLTMTATKTMPRQALLLGERRVAVTPMGEWLRFTGRLELSNHDTRPNPKHIAGIERAVREYIQLDERLNVKETWAGLRPTTPDGMPIIGISPKHNNLILATGHAMLGLSLGPGTGQIVSEIANGKPTAFDIHALQSERFD
ncbi:MAG TPA: FAD-dependent oxidoreductase [Anaerolineales bacterium]|nr:FAD-dependent oxidoreductase [Anaerolineales bacterium]